MKIFFTRHTEKNIAVKNKPLTKKGIKQAKYLAKELNQYKFTTFYCSNLLRSKQTAEIISKKLKLKPKGKKCLNEFEGENFKIPKPKWTLKKQNQYNKLLFFLEKITKNPTQEKNILITAHGNTNRLIIAHFLKLNAKQGAPFAQSLGAINILSWGKDFNKWRLKLLNYDQYLPKKLK